MKFMKNKTTSYAPLYRSKCQFIASTLYALGEKLDSTEWINGECFFIFEDAKKCSQIVKDYYAGEIKVDPRVLFNSLKDIKSIIFNN